MNDSLKYTVSRPARATFTGSFIAFEGADGAGKSTQVQLLETALTAQGYEVLTTREPGGTELGEILRSLVLSTDHADLDPRTEALILAAGRAAHVEQKILPALKAGKIVLCDRYIDSSAAYQGAGRGLGITNVTALNLWATHNLLPDLTVLLDIPLNTGRHRRGTRGTVDRLEAEPDSFHTKVHRAYGEIAAHQSHRYALVDGTGTVDQVHRGVLDAVENILEKQA